MCFLYCKLCCTGGVRSPAEKHFQEFPAGETLQEARRRILPEFFRRAAHSACTREIFVVRGMEMLYILGMHTSSCFLKRYALCSPYEMEDGALNVFHAQPCRAMYLPLLN
jgi:hypothetical protein